MIAIFWLVAAMLAFWMGPLGWAIWWMTFLIWSACRIFRKPVGPPQN